MRRQYITHPAFQYGFTFSFVIGVLLVLFLIGGSSIGTFVLLSRESGLSTDQQTALIAAALRMTRFIFFLSIPVIICFTYLGIYLSYKFIGPLYRLESWLEGVLLRDESKPLVLRPGDELEGIAKALSRAVQEKMRGQK